MKLMTMPNSTSLEDHIAIRFWLYCHVVALALTAMFSLADSRIISLPVAIDGLVWVMFPALAALFVCPIAIFVYVVRSPLDAANRLKVIVLESMIVFAHLFAMLPAVQ